MTKPMLIIGLILTLGVYAAEKPSALSYRSPAEQAATTRATEEKRAAKHAFEGENSKLTPSTSVPIARGLASFYGGEYQGRTTSSGSQFEAADLLAAHPSYPFGTKVRVTRVSTGASVVVTIADRGKFAGSRIISVSRKAADLLGFVSAGTTEVTVEVLDASKSAAQTGI